jgi:hypothetical protein
MTFVHKSHQLFYLAAATAIIAAAVVIATAHLPQKELQTTKASPIENVETPIPHDDYQMDMNGY